MQPWRRNDHNFVRENKYPKLKEGMPPAPGKTPDLDIEEYLTFKHRKRADDWLAYETRMIHKFAPEAKVIASTHPAMETVYLPLQDRWPYAECTLRTASGEIFHHPGYDRTHLLEFSKKDWVVGYYVPYSGSRYYEAIIQDIEKTLALGVDGFYVDEFSLGAHRDYCRYDYSRWDGFSADLDDNGNVVRLKSDVCYAIGPLQSDIISRLMQKGKFILGNGSAVLRTINNAPVLRFWEGASGFATTSGAHLNHIPMIYGNYGDETTGKGIFHAVRDAIGAGCLYSPRACNLLLKGRDNFVCKQYPMTIVDIGPGLIIGKERILTTQSGCVDWLGTKDAKVVFYRYDAEGNLLPQTAGNVLKGKIEISVEKDGLTIVEKQ